MRTKDRPLLLRRAIQSVINQSYENWSIALVNNGGSIEDVKKVVDDYRNELQDKHVKIHLEKSFFMEVATNIGIENSESEYITLLDDDDSWHPDFLMQCVELLELDKTIDGVVTQSILVNEILLQNEVIENTRQEFNRTLRKVTLFKLLQKNLYTTNSFVYRRKVIEQIGPYRKDLPVLGDWEFNIRFIAQKKIQVLAFPLSYYHKRIIDSKDNHYNNSSTYDHLLFDKIIRKQYFTKFIKDGCFFAGSSIVIFGYVNRIKGLLKVMLKYKR
jgi:glycosyltransferase involved in cell wall biosynthesis